jgi:hypothetical protein
LQDVTALKHFHAQEDVDGCIDAECEGCYIGFRDIDPYLINAGADVETKAWTIILDALEHTFSIRTHIGRAVKLGAIELGEGNGNDDAMYRVKGARLQYLFNY